MVMTARTTITLPGDLLGEIDRRVGPRGRSAFLARAAANELKRDRLQAALEAGRGVMVGRPGWRSGDEILASIDAMRADDRDVRSDADADTDADADEQAQ